MGTKLASQSQRQVNFHIRPLSTIMAAAVTGLDLSQPLDSATRKAVYDAFLTYKVLVFRDQQLSKQQQIDFSEQFGTLERHTLRNQGADAFPLVHVVSNLNAEGKPRGALGSTKWHTDKSFRPQPSMAPILHGITLPPSGGDTCFADMYAAYEALPEAEKAELDQLRVVHSWELSRENLNRQLSEEEKRDAPTTSHPLVRTHPDTGRKCLFIGIHASYLEGLPIEEGRRRIEQLEAHATQAPFIYRHQWRKGDVLMWDNRCLLHRADPNFDAARYPRVLNRTCLRGTPTS
jgi:alpha-ketoglutarate-dependent taurine dioxygenase